MMLRLRLLLNPKRLSFSSSETLYRQTVHPAANAHSPLRLRLYSTTTPFSSESAATAPSPTDRSPTPDPKEWIKRYTDQRTAYKKSVSALRKKYAAEIAIQRQRDEKVKAEKAALQTRRKLERQRLKNLRSVQSAIRQREERLRRHEEFQEELRLEQVKRDAKNERFAKARKLLIQELEEESPLWLTTHEEVEKALSGAKAMQELWTYPASVVGAPDPTGDAGYWRYEGHTWDMRSTYKTRQELLLEELDEMCYEGANVDASYWTKERLSERRGREEKAKLRAMVREEGRRVLLKKQGDLLRDRYALTKEEEEEGKIAKPMPVPKLNVLAAYKEQERIGAKVLAEDPTKFFVFDEEDIQQQRHDHDDEDAAGKSKGLGKPIRLRDPIRDGNTHGPTPYPVVLGKMPRPDMRTEKEKKREERERKMLAAARGEESEDDAIEFAASEMYQHGSDPIKYEEVAAMDEDDLEWEEGLDPEEDKELLSVPSGRRYREEEIDWVLEQLQEKAKKVEAQLELELESQRREAQAKAEMGEAERAIRGGNQEDWKWTHKRDDLDGVNIDLEGMGVDVDEMRDVLAALTPDQMAALEALDDEREEEGGEMTSEDVAKVLEKVPGLSEEQFRRLLQLERTLSENDDLREALKEDEKKLSGAKYDELMEMLEDEGLKEKFEQNHDLQKITKEEEGEEEE